MNLTKSQELIWDMERFAGGSIAVVCTSMLRNGHKDPNDLQQAVDQLFMYNDALRTRIRINGEKVTQYVVDHCQQHAEVLHFLDKASLTAYVESYCTTPIDLSGQLCEIKILILPEQYGLLVKIHHLIADAWTMALLATQFNMIIEGKEPHAYSYLNYREREADYRNSKRYLRDKQFFLNQTDQCKNPVFIREQNVETYVAGRETFVIQEEDTARIRNFCTQTDCSVLSLFATVLALYISRINGNTEKLFIGTTVLNRVNEQEMHTAGMFVNTVPILLSLKPDKMFRENMEVADDAVMSVFRHQRYNYKELLDDMRGELVSGGRLFDVILNYMNAYVDGTRQETQSVWHHNGMQNESLQIHLDDRDREGVLRVTYDYQKEKFEKSEIIGLHGHLMNMLFDGMEHPERLLSELNMLSPAENQQLLCDFNNTEKTYSIPDGSNIYSLFEETTKQNANKTCICIGDKRLRYEELLHYSEMLDGMIRGFTGNKKSVIAVIAERSLEMYCAIYGIIRGGNAYLPIAPDYPTERIEYMLENSGASLVIAQEQFVHLIGDASCINISDIMKNPPQTVTDMACAATEDDIAYVIYTSGSTGKPKGAQISHQAVVNRVLWMNDVYPLGENGTILQKTPFSFDVSVWEIFWWGMCGGSMVASKPGEHFLPSKILEEVFCNHVTHLHFVPSVFDLFVKYLEDQSSERYRFESVKHVFVSGEVLNPELVQRFYALYDYEKVRLHNLYGPTECAIDVTFYDCLPSDKNVPIGMPIYNTQIYIADAYLNLLPNGIKGELLIGGQNVGLGYVNDPTLTASRFVENPFGEGMLYKTGDFAYRREDGQIMFCERMDSQVKLNGQRIEIGEIEAVIRNVQDVESVVVVIRVVNGTQVLLAYYCGNADLEHTIREACEQKLPRYMIPKWLIRLDQMPLHPNGKLDRKALENLPFELPDMDLDEEPINAIEKHICEVFGIVLGNESVGRHSDFFELGGTSLSMISFFVESGYEDVTPAQFMRHATPAKFAAFIKKYRDDGSKHIEPLLTVPSSKKAYVFFPYAGGNADAYVNMVDSIEKLNRDIAIYFMPYLHTDTECCEAAEEMMRLLDGYEVYFYAHCAGAALALRILQILEEKQSGIVKHFFIAASVPFRQIGTHSVWHYVSDNVIKRVLLKAGAPLDLFSNQKSLEILKQFRNDTDFAAHIFAKTRRKIQCPVSLVTGKKDLFTRFSWKKEKQWRRYVCHIEKVYCIDTASHYFQSENSDCVAELIVTEK